MAKGEYSLRVPAGIYNVVASKDGYISQTVENVKVYKGQTTIVNIQLGGEDNMETYPIEVLDGTKITINIPVNEPALPVEILDVHTGNPVPERIVELLSADETTLLQTKTTTVAGIATFTDVSHGLYNIKT